MKKGIRLFTLILFVLCAFAACGSGPDAIESQRPEPDRPPPARPSDPISEPPIDSDIGWPNRIYDTEPQWWTKPGWGIATTVDWVHQMMGLNFRAPDDLLPVAEEMAITYYLHFVAPSRGFEAHALPLIAAAAAGEFDVQVRIVTALSNRLVSMMGIEMYRTYLGLFSDRGLVYDEVTAQIFEQIHILLAECCASTEAGRFASELPAGPALTVSDIVRIFTARADADPVEDMLPSLAAVEDMQMFRRSPAAFLEAAYIAGIPFYGFRTADEAETPHGPLEVHRIAAYIAMARHADPILYAYYHDFLRSAAELDLSESARLSLNFLHEQLESTYREWRSAA